MRPLVHVTLSSTRLCPDFGESHLCEVPFNKERFNLLSMQAAAIAFTVIIEIFRKSLEGWRPGEGAARGGEEEWTQWSLKAHSFWKSSSNKEVQGISRFLPQCSW